MFSVRKTHFWTKFCTKTEPKSPEVQVKIRRWLLPYRQVVRANQSAVRWDQAKVYLVKKQHGVSHVVAPCFNFNSNPLLRRHHQQKLGAYSSFTTRCQQIPHTGPLVYYYSTNCMYFRQHFVKTLTGDRIMICPLKM